MTAPRRAAVVGGSLGGLLAAHMLWRDGWDVHVYERLAEELEERGAGLVTHPELMQALEDIDIRIGDDVGVPVQERLTLDRTGAVIGRRPLPQVFTAWGRLYSVLKTPFPADRYHAGHALQRIESDERSVRLQFANGVETRVDLLVAADGIRSTARQQLAPGVKPAYAGYVAWRGLVDEAAFSDRAIRELFPYFAFSVPPGEQILGYPVAGRGGTLEPGRRRFNLVWYRPADEDTALRDLLTDAGGRVWPEGIPHPLIRPEVVAAVRREAADVLGPQFLEAVEKADNLFFQPIFDLESPRLVHGRVLLLGDAAFVARPHCGMGVTKAAGDARVLRDALRATPDVDAALARYDAERSAFGRFIVGHARALGAYMQAQIRTPVERAMAEKYRTPERVMTETAVPPEAPPMPVSP